MDSLKVFDLMIERAELLAKLRSQKEVGADISETERALDANSRELFGDLSDVTRRADLYSFEEKTKSQRQKDNNAAFELLDKIEAGEVNGDELTDEQRGVLAAYSGSGGGLKSRDGKVGSLHEYYTPAPVVKGMWDAVRELGFAGGKVLDPSAGTGIFGAFAGEDAVVDSIEMDATSAAVNKYVNAGSSGNVTNASFEEVAAKTEDNQYDLVITNVPFADAAERQHRYKDTKYRQQTLQGYFILRGLDKLRYGGIAAFIVPASVLDGKGGKESKVRIAASLKAEFKGAYRLPNSVFGTAGADVATDIIFFKKHSKEATEIIEDLYASNQQALSDAGVLWSDFIDGKYFKVGEHKKYIIGTESKKKNRWGEMAYAVEENGSLADIAKAIKAFGNESRIDWKALDAAEAVSVEYADGDVVYSNGTAYQMNNGKMVEMAADDIRSDEDVAIENLASSVKTPYDAFRNKVSFSDAEKFVRNFTNRKLEMQIPSWLGRTVQFAGFEKDDSAKQAQWDIALVASCVKEVIEAYPVEDKLNRFPELSNAMIVVSGLNPSNSIKNHFRDELSLLSFHYDKKDKQFSAVWRGDVDAETVNTPESVVEAMMYEANARKIEIDKLAGVDIDFYTNDEWAVTSDGYVMKADDYFVGNVADLIDSLQADIESATDAKLKAKLERMMQIANQRVGSRSAKGLSFDLRSPFIDNRYIKEWLNTQISRNLFTVYETDEKGRQYVDIQSKSSTKTDEEKLLCRVGDYLSSGRYTTGGIKLYKTERDPSATWRVLEIEKTKAEIRDDLRQLIKELNAKFNIYVQSNEKILAEVEAKLNDPQNLYFPRVDDESDLGIKGMSDEVKLHGFQSSFVRKQAREFGGINSFDVGLGKAQPLDAKVLTPNGWVKMGSIKRGDLVVAYDGSVVPVTGVFPQGEKDIYSVEFSDGFSTKCCDEHLWVTKTIKDRRKDSRARKKGVYVNTLGSVKELSEIRTSLYKDNLKNHAIPMVGRIDFPAKDFVIPPYVLGVILGDGNITDPTTLRVANPDEFIFEKINSLIAGSDVRTNIVKSKDRCFTFSIKRKKGMKSNAFKDELARYGLMGKYSHEKYIPRDYMFGSYEQRLELLSGLLDTDGLAYKNGTVVEYFSTSREMADGVAELVQSLGGVAKVRTRKEVYYIKDGIKVYCKECHIVLVNMPKNINPFSLPRKRNRVQPSRKNEPSRFITSVKYVGKEQAQCISIDHKDHLYITDNYIVTHNTATALATAQYAHSVGTKKKTVFVVPNSVLSNWHKEAKKFYSGDTVESCLFVGGSFDDDGQLVVNSSNYARDLSKVVEGKYSKIFMTQQAFEKIRLKPETVERYYEYLSQVDASFKESILSADVEKSLATKAQFVETLTSKDKLSNAPFFEDMGIDSVVVDEAHHFKNAKAAVRTMGQQIKGMGLGATSARGIDMMAKSWFVRDGNVRNDGVLLLTATPLTNSPLELYSMTSLAVGEERVNKEMMVNGADEFLSAICEVENREDVNIIGESVSVDILVGIKNNRLVQQMFHNVSDVKTADDVLDSFVQVAKTDERVGIRLTNEMDAALEEMRDVYNIARRYAKDQPVDDVSLSMAMNYAARNGISLKTLASPFNVIDRMNKLLLDPELLEEVSFFDVSNADESVVSEVVKKFNAKKVTFIATKEPKRTPDEWIIGKPKKTFTDDGELKSYSVKVLAQAVYADGQVVINTNDFKVQQIFDEMLEAAGVDASFSISPKMAALIENVKLEQANIRAGNGGENNKYAKQIVFIESLAMHVKAKRLIAKNCGIPSNRITFISGQANNGTDEILDVQDGFNAQGEDNRYSIAIANKRAEVGINLQVGTQAIHHIESRWTPDSEKQRNGRGVRQGNTSSNVNVYVYEADGTFDSYRRRIIQAKDNWIGSVMHKDDSDRLEVTGGLTDREYDMLINFKGSEAEYSKLQDELEKSRREQRAKETMFTQNVNIKIAKESAEWLEEYKDVNKYASAIYRSASALVSEFNDAHLKYDNSRRKGSSDKTVNKNLKDAKAVFQELVGMFVKFGSLFTFKVKQQEVELKSAVEMALFAATSRVYDFSKHASKYADLDISDKLAGAEKFHLDFNVSNIDKVQEIYDERKEYHEKSFESSRQTALEGTKIIGAMSEEEVEASIIGQAFARTKDGRILTHKDLIKSDGNVMVVRARSERVELLSYLPIPLKDGKPAVGISPVFAQITNEAEVANLIENAEVIGKKGTADYERLLMELAKREEVLIMNDFGEELKSRIPAAYASYYLPEVENFVSKDVYSAPKAIRFDTLMNSFKPPYFPRALVYKDGLSEDMLKLRKEQEAIVVGNHDGGYIYISPDFEQYISKSEPFAIDCIEYMVNNGIKANSMHELGNVIPLFNVRKLADVLHSKFGVKKGLFESEVINVMKGWSSPNGDIKELSSSYAGKLFGYICSMSEEQLKEYANETIGRDYYGILASVQDGFNLLKNEGYWPDNKADGDKAEELPKDAEDSEDAKASVENAVSVSGTSFNDNKRMEMRGVAGYGFRAVAKYIGRGDEVAWIGRGGEIKGETDKKYAESVLGSNPISAEYHNSWLMNEEVWKSALDEFYFLKNSNIVVKKI